MSLLQWDDGFETGIPAADHEHGKLVDLVNTIYERWQRKGHRYPAELFEDLVRIFRSHFDFEDRIMSEIDFPERAAHARDHDQVLSQLRAIVARAVDPGFDVAGVLAPCLQGWLADHIRHHDAPLYRSLVSGNGAAAAGGEH